MRVLIVDDEPLARQALERVLSTRTDIDEHDSASDAFEAAAKLESRPYDILLLDIHMPGMTGLKLLDVLQERGGLLPAVIFVTAFDEHAIAAFDHQASDYILKPFNDARVHRALDSAKRRTQNERLAELAELLPRLEQQSAAPPTRIAVKSKGRVVFIVPDEILAAVADGNYVLLEQENGSHLLREPISELAEKLRPYGFVRIHRSVLVNSAHVETLEPLTTGEYRLRLKGGKNFNVTRTYKKNLKALASFWIGPDALVSD
jgi:two-component system, LytTR family, response regulator